MEGAEGSGLAEGAPAEVGAEEEEEERGSGRLMDHSISDALKILGRVTTGGGWQPGESR